MENCVKEYRDLSELMNNDEKVKYLNPEERQKEQNDGNIYHDIVPGMIVTVHVDGYDKKAFILALNDNDRCITAIPVTNKSCEGAIRLTQSEPEIEVGKSVKQKILGHVYIRTDRIETYRYDDIVEYDKAGIVPTITYIKILDKVMDHIHYDDVSEAYESSKETYTYEDYTDELQYKLNQTPSKKRQLIMDPKDLVIQNMKKEITKIHSELETAKKYKESSKNEIKQLKQNYQDMKKDFDNQKAKNTNLVLDAEKAVKEKDEMKEKYQTLLEKYAEAGDNTELKNENKTLKESLTDTEKFLNDANKQIEQLKKDLEEYKKSLSTSDLSMRQLTKNINDLKKEISGQKTEISKKDKIIKDLQNKTEKTAKDSEIVEDLNNEVATLKEQLSQKAARPTREYTLTPASEAERENKESIDIPSVIGYKLRKLMTPVPEELRVAFLMQMINHFEDSIKEGDITVNMVTKFTL